MIEGTKMWRIKTKKI